MNFVVLMVVGTLIYLAVKKNATVTTGTFAGSGALALNASLYPLAP